MPFSITDELFFIGYYGIALGLHEMVLDVQWLESLGPILWDFGCCVIQFVRNAHTMRWTVMDHTPAPTAFTASTDDVMGDLLLRFEGIFTTPIGLSPVRPRSHHIRLLPGTLPVAVRPSRYAHTQKAELELQCQATLQSGVIWPSTLAFLAPVLLVKKADDTWQFCMDYRTLNSRTIKDKYPIPVVNELLDELHGTTFFTKLDLCSGYYQVRMHDDVEKMAFHTHDGLFKFLVMPFGLTNAPAAFQVLMNDVLWSFLHRFVLVFFDDILIYSTSWSEHLRHIHLMLAKLQEH
jgi:hypothetical protein